MPVPDLLVRLGVTHPIILAPMGGGPGTPELAAAVCQAGALGSLAAADLTPAQIGEQVRRLRALTSRPFNLNLFAGGHHGDLPVDATPMIALLADIHAELGLPAPTLPPVLPDPFPQQLEAVLEARPAVFSFTFGVPPREAMQRVKARGIFILGTATTVAEARLLAEAGVDGIVAQGAEAGAHRGTFAHPCAAAMVPTLELVRGVVAAVALPVIASGGLMDGADVATALAAGAAAVQLGTAFLPCPESGAPPAHKQALLAARADTTVITRAFSGRPARSLANAFTRTLAGGDHLILPFPLQHALTRPMRTAAAARGQADYLSLWAGTGVARSRALPAAELVRTLVAELRAAS